MYGTVRYSSYSMLHDERKLLSVENICLDRDPDLDLEPQQFMLFLLFTKLFLVNFQVAC
jgi:hypothetical protein